MKLGPSVYFILISCSTHALCNDNKVHIMFPSYKEQGKLNHLNELSICAKNEENIHNAVEEHLKYLQKELKGLTRYVEDYDESSGKIWEDAASEDRGRLVASSGISGYRMVDRLIQLKSGVQRGINITELLIPNEDYWPNLRDLNNTMSALVHLIETLDLPLDQLGHILSGGKERGDLRAKHGAQIGLYALGIENFAIALEFYEWAKMQVTQNSDGTISREIIHQLLVSAIDQHNIAIDKLPDSFLNTYDHKVSLEDRPEERIKRKDLYKNETKGGSNYASIISNFWSLCSGETLLTEEERKALVCYYQGNRAELVIGPLKVEQLAPELLQFHQVLGEREVEQLTRSKRKTDSEADEYDLTKNWPYIEELLYEPSFLNERVELITGLKAIGPQAAEPTVMVEQVAGRQNGTFSRPHLDPVITEEFQARGGDLLATLVFYLNDVVAGGETAFSIFKASSPPLKRSAVLWYNMKRNGKIRNDTYHASCPVTYGKKIAGAKTVRYNAQFQTFRCTLDPNE